MGLFSGKQIERMLDEGVISMEPAPMIGEASADLALETLICSNYIQADIGWKQLESESFDDFIRRECQILDFSVPQTLKASRMYYGYSKEKVRLPSNLQRIVSSRSSVARLFLWIDSDVEFHKGEYCGKIPFIMNSFGPGITIYPGHRYAQVVLHDGLWLRSNELLVALHRGEINLEKNGKPLDHRNYFDYNRSRIVLTLHPNIDIVTGQCFDAAKPSDNQFTRVDLCNFPEGFALPEGTCFLASTAEKISLSENYAGQLEMWYPFMPRSALSVHPNAPFQMPGSKNSMVLECKVNQEMLLEPGMPIASMLFWSMNEPSVYNGRYVGQSEIVKSKSHEGL